jgi:hypothetical protein
MKHSHGIPLQRGDGHVMLCRCKTNVRREDLSMDYDAVRQIALAFPGVEEHLAFGRPTLRVGKKFLACIAKIDEDTLCLKIKNDMQRDILIASKPDVFYNTPHYADFGSVLIRLPVVDPDELRDLIEDAWRGLATKRMMAEFQTE